LNKMITIEGYKSINQSKSLRNLNNLNLLCNQIGDVALKELLKPSEESQKQYISLNLCDCLVSTKGLDILCNSDATKILEAVYLDANNFSILNSWQKFNPLPKLKKLSAQSCNLDDFTLQTLLSILNLENLVYLDVSFNDLLIMDLSKASKMRNLREILAENTLIDESFFDKLVQKGEPHKLEKVSLRRGKYYSTIFEQLAKNKLFPNLNFINLSRTSPFQNNLFFLYYPFAETSESLETLNLSSTEIDLLLWKSALLNNVYFNNLRELKLVNVIRNGSSMIDLINKSEKFKNLVVLEMTACGLGDIALHLLAADTKFYELKRLILSLNMFRYKGIKRFLRSKLCSQLEYLDMTKGVIREMKKITALRVYQGKYQKNLVFDI